jgi:hypothetical protein
MRAALAMLLILAPLVQAANELQSFAPGVSTAYAVIREADGDVWYVSGQVFEAWGTGGRTAADYDIALTDKSGDMFVGDFDTNVSNGSYIVATHYQVAGAPADSDPIVWIQEGDWNGSTFASSSPSAATIADSVWDEATADHTTETTFGGELGGLDPNLAFVLADTNELQTDWTDGGRLDLLIDAIKAMTDLISVNTTTVAAPNDVNNFTITAGQDVNDAYWMHAIMVEDAGDSHSEVRWISQYNTSRDVSVDEPFSFTPAAGDNVWILGPVYGGFLYNIQQALSNSSAPTHYFDHGAGVQGPGDTSYYLQDGSDP